MEPQEYEVTHFKPSDFQDNYGNTWCEAALKGVSEPVRWVVKDPTKVSVGDTVYGHIEQATSKAGKPYNRFKTDKREDYNQSNNNAPTAPKPATSTPRGDGDYWSDKDKAIRAQWAIGQAKDWALGNAIDFDSIEACAVDFYAMVERVKGGTTNVLDQAKANMDKVLEVSNDEFSLKDLPSDWQ